MANGQRGKYDRPLSGALADRRDPERICQWTLVGSNSACSTVETDPNKAGHTGFLTIDEARQMANEFRQAAGIAHGRATE
jgi:hypothetical protein